MSKELNADNLIGQQLDEYRLEKLLGQGGMARVYRGLDVRLNRYVAIKVIDAPFQTNSEYMLRFEREAQAIAKLGHPNIVTLYRYGEAQGMLYIAMQYVEGTDLDYVLQNYRGDDEFIEPEEVIRITREVCRALDYAHSKEIIHRDIKPANIMLDQQGTAYLTDFGLALLEEVGTRGEIFGTPHYIAPEQAMSSAAAKPQSDLYAMGVILYEMFTGKLPFDAPNVMDVAIQHIHEPPPPPREVRPEIPEALEEVILKALDKDSKARYQTGAALADAVEQAFQETGESVLLTTVPGPRLSVPEQVAMELAANPLPPIPAEVATPAARPTQPDTTPVHPSELALPPTKQPLSIVETKAAAPGGRRTAIYTGVAGLVVIALVTVILILASTSGGEGNTVSTTNAIELLTVDIEQMVVAELTDLAAETATKEMQQAMTLTRAASTSTPSSTSTSTPTASLTFTATATPSPSSTAASLPMMAETSTFAQTQVSPTPPLSPTIEQPTLDIQETVTAQLTQIADETATADARMTAAPTEKMPSPIPEATPTLVTIECAGALPARLAIGGAGITKEFGRGVFDSPNGKLTTTLLEESPFLVVGGPECTLRQLWWQIRTRNGIEGWISEGSGNYYVLDTCPVLATGDYELDCPNANPSRLRAGQNQFRSWIRGLRVRAEPGLSTDEVYDLSYQEIVTVTGGPNCADDLIWWYVQTADGETTGWIAESAGRWLTIPEPWLGCQE